ncbi:HD domain-containing protein [Alteromonas pelagimontana]|uniref:HD domain-containing protein n=1 Tax=Alteromonas pelagimontana TaxID=1858656 RepID=A0A6M4MAW9_9ALTE|nr:HD domain-containing protein [Alteromonas pelagimontana]QJR80334.1 HD domain-containing protein [Alteromonas pelagimontana]
MEFVDAHASFIQELDKLKAVKRQVRLPVDANRQENSAEHSWHVALMTTVLAEYAAEPINIARVVQMILIHDLVEIDAGDMFAFAEASDHAEQELKELAAAKRIFGILPEAQGQAYLKLWLEFEAAITADAQFAKCMDRVLPVFQNMRAGGGSWTRHKVTREKIINRNALLESAAPALWRYVNQQLNIAVEKGWLQQ